MPASSKQQQKFMGLVHAIQKGDIEPSDVSPEAQKVAQDMNPSDVKDFAATSHKGLPKRVKQEILKKLKEYAMTLPGHHAKSAAPMEPLRSDYEMDLQKEDRIPQSFNYGTTRDYHTKLATTPRKKYDKTNFNPAHSGQEDLQEGDDKLEMLKLFNKALRMMPGSQKQKEIIKQLNVIRSRNGLKPLDEKQVVNKIAEYAANLDNSYILNKDAKLDGTPEEKDAINREVKSIKETAPCWKGYKQVGMKTKGGKQVPNCVKESINESSDINSLKKIHDAIFKFLKTKKGVGEVKEFSEFPNRYGDNVSTFSVKYNIEDKYNYDLQEIKIEYSTSRVFIPNKGYFPFKTFNDIKNIINKKSSLKESVNESDLKGYLVGDVVDDIIKSIGTRFVSGEIKQSNKNKIYLKLKDVKFGSGVVKILKSRFGIDAKEEMFGGKDKFGSIPSVSFFANKVVSESVNEEKVYIDYLNKAKGFKQDRIKFNSYEDAVKWARQNFDKFSPDMIKYESINEGRELKSIQSDLNKTIVAIQSEISSYKATKGTPQEKKHIDNLKKLHPIKKKLESELESVVSGLYKDAELKIED